MAQTAVLTPLEAVCPQRPLLQRVYRTARSKPLGTLSFIAIGLLVVMAVFAPVVAPVDPDTTHRGQLLKPPSGQFLMGTDHFGRDIFSRIVVGTRVSLLVGLASVALGVVGGSLIGIVSGYFEGPLDLVVQRLMDALMALPTIVLALTIVAAIGPGMLNVIIAIGSTQIPRINRVVRGSTLSEKQNVYVEAARAMGCSNVHIMRRHMLPNVAAPIIVIATLTLATAIIQEASLSFLGVGVPADIPSWGGMLSGEARKFMLAQPWMAVWPGVAITVSVLAWNLLGDALRDVLDPRLRGTT